MLRRNFSFRNFLIPRYIIGAMTPYIVLALLLLTAILLAQQASRLTDVLIYADLPFSLLGSIGAALSARSTDVLIPLATLAGIIIGYSRMGSDSEIVAMRSAGVGSWTMIWPALLIGLVVSGVTTYLHLKEAPEGHARSGTHRPRRRARKTRFAGRASDVQHVAALRHLCSRR